MCPSFVWFFTLIFVVKSASVRARWLNSSACEDLGIPSVCCCSETSVGLTCAGRTDLKPNVIYCYPLQSLANIECCGCTNSSYCFVCPMGQCLEDRCVDIRIKSLSSTRALDLVMVGICLLLSIGYH
eukprot:TRINITY_DN9679_c0_g2_i2.p1 TRINITY_DN9679_c0_g2~~TRINITY_DN9679_c0_g2_i2.p1  ORF type:complete len:127 (-),score=12.19 TRINITY_DN9679_c0_g2_i2:44-424(-)